MRLRPCRAHARRLALGDPRRQLRPHLVERADRLLGQRGLGGEDFGDLARQYTDDIGSAQEGGDLGWAGKGQFVPVFEQAMAETGINQISQPFQSQYGWHILQVLERRKYDVSDANAREHARRVLYQRKFQDELEVWLQKIRDEAYVDIKS